MNPILKNTSPLYHTLTQTKINSKLRQLVQTCNFIEALEHYTKLWNNGFKPDNFTFPYILKAASAAHRKHPFMGLVIHNHAIKTGFDSNVFVSNSLILFYGQFAQFKLTRYLFDKMPQKNVVTWTALIWACIQNHYHEFYCAIELFKDMLLAGVNPNSYTMATVLPAFFYDNGVIQIHGFMMKRGFESDVYVLTALIDVYAKCGSILLARKVFDEMPERNLVSWNAMMSGYNQNGNARESLELFARMNKCSSGIVPDSYSVVTLLFSCSSLTMLPSGKEIHCFVYKAGLEEIVFVGNGLIDMYGKCGALEVAERVFDKMMRERDVGSWTALINCFGLHGQGTKAISIFEKMKQIATITPNDVTMTAVLTACAHSCLVEDGLRYFEAMHCDFSIEPTMKHYACIVNLLGRAGLLEEALEFINKMPIQADVQVWEGLLGVATIQGNEKVVEIATMHLIKMELGSNAEVQVQLANTYGNAGRWENVAEIRGPQKKLRKLPGQSWIQFLQ